MLWNSNKRQWIQYENGQFEEIRPGGTLALKKRDPGYPDWWVVEKDIKWKPRVLAIDNGRGKPVLSNASPLNANQTAREMENLNRGKTSSAKQARDMQGRLKNNYQSGPTYKQKQATTCEERNVACKHYQCTDECQVTGSYRPGMEDASGITMKWPGWSSIVEFGVKSIGSKKGKSDKLYPEEQWLSGGIVWKYMCL